MAATQRDTLGMFTALCLARETWAGALLVGVGLNDAGRALALASLAAGAASIFLEQNAAELRAAQREGCCTFSVTSLDEALRIVKNEVRQRHAISVGLRGDARTWLEQMVERGVQPQAFASSRVLMDAEAAATDVLCERGMQTFRGFRLQPVRSSDIDLAAMLMQASSEGWSLDEQQASSLSERRTQDAELLGATPQDGSMARIARRWLHAAPALFPRALQRTYWRNN